MTYEAAVAHLYALGHELGVATTRKFDLAHMRALAAALQHPERRFASVLIAGTNGKGSTAATLASILRAAGYRTGLYTSPHLVRVNERIRINGEEISDAEFTEMYGRVGDTAQRLISAGELPHEPSFFETLTAMAFEYFASSGVEVAVLEVGMGGRLDATNIVEPCVSVITDIALDHQKFLGNTITEIAREKAGIIRPNGTVVTLPQHPEANDVIGNTILERNARAVNAAQYVPPVSPGAAEFFASVGADGPARRSARSPLRAQNFSAVAGLSANAASGAARNSYPLSVLSREIVVESPLTGRHQLRNIALAIAAAVELKHCGFATTPEQIERGIRETTWPGRFQIIPTHEGWPDVVLDVA